MLEKLIKLAFTLFSPYVCYVALGEYYLVHFQHARATHPFGQVEQMDHELAGPLSSLNYEHQLLWVGGVAALITILLVAAWFIRKLFNLAVICGAGLLMYVMYTKYIR